MKKKDDETPGAGIKPAIGFVAAVGAIFTLGALALFPTKTGLSVMFGALAATSNLWVLSKIVEALLTPDPDATSETKPEATSEANPEGEASADPEAPKEPEPPKKSFSTAWGALAAVKMIVLFGGAWVLMTRGLVDPMGLMVGYGSLPVGVSLSGFVSGLRPKKRK